MISLDQVVLLQKKVEAAVVKIQSLNQEIAQLKSDNDALRRKCVELTNSLSDKTGLVSSLEAEQVQIEESILKALDQLDAVEDSVLSLEENSGDEINETGNEDLKKRIDEATVKNEVRGLFIANQQRAQETTSPEQAFDGANQQENDVQVVGGDGSSVNPNENPVTTESDTNTATVLDPLAFSYAQNDYNPGDERTDASLEQGGEIENPGEESGSSSEGEQSEGPQFDIF